MIHYTFKINSWRGGDLEISLRSGFWELEWKSILEALSTRLCI